MTRKYRLALGLVGVAAVGGGIALVRDEPHPNPVSVADCRRITFSMTEPQVEAILGRPADRSGPPGPVERPDLTHDGFGMSRDGPDPPARESLWWTERGALQVQFDSGGRVCTVFYREPVPTGEAAARYLRRLREWVGL